MAIKRTPVKATARLKDKTFKAGKTTTGSNKDYGGNKYGGAQNTQNSSAPSLSTKKTDATRTPVKATARLKEKTFSAGVTTKGSNKNYGVGGYGGVQNYASSKTGKALNLDFQNDKLKVNKNGARGISQNNKGKTYTAGKGYSDRGARPKSYNIKRFNTENKDEMIGQISQSWTKAMGDYSKKTGISPEQVVNMIETGNTGNLPKSLINAYNSDKNATKIVNKEYKGVEVRGKGVYRSEEVKQAEKESKKQDSVLAAKSAKNNKASELWTQEMAAYSKKTGASPADVLNAIETGNTSSLPKTLVDAYFASENAASQWHKADANANQAAATLGTAKKAEDDKKTEAAYKAAAQSDKNYSEYLKKGKSNRYGAQAMTDTAMLERAQAYATAYGGSAIQELEKEALKPFMTASQVDIYNYTLGKYGREEANKYYDSVYEQVQKRAATAINTILSEETYDKIDASGNDTVKWAKDLAKGSLPFMRTFQAFYGGATDGFQNIGRTMKIAMGAMPEAEKYQLSQGAYTHNTISERLDGFEKVINDCVYSVGNMMPAITVSVATGGLGAPATVAAMASAGTTWASVFGSNYTQSMREGYTEEQAVTYAAINASFEAALQYALNGVSQVAGGFTTEKLARNATKAVEKLSMNKTAQKALKTIVSMSVDASGEFTEEYLQGVIDAYVRNAVFGENNDTNPFTWEKIYQGLLGALTAYSMNITSAVSENTVDGISLDEAETGVLPQGRMSAQRGAAQNTSNVQAVETPALNKYAGKEVVDSVLGRRGEASVSMIAKYSDAETAAEAKFSIVTNNKGQQYVKADRQVIKGNSPAKWKVDVENYINNSIRQGKDVQFTAADGDILTITADTAGKAKFRNTVRDKNGRIRIMTKKEFAAKLRAEAHIDEVSQVSIRGAQTVPDYKNHSFAKDGFNYRTAYFEDVDGTQYKLTVSVGIDGSIKTIYNIGKLNKTQFSLGAQDLLYNQGPADALSIQRNNDLLQNQYSPDSGLTENYVSSEPSPDTVVQTLQVPSTMSENAVPLQELGTRIGEDSYSADNVPQAADSVKLPMVEKYSDAETAAEAAENIAVNNSIRGRAEYDTIDANEDGGITYNESANVFDSDERWVGIRETGGPESVCESTASLAERRAAADNVRKTGGYERFSIETNDQEITLDIISDENLLPEDAKFLQKYNKEKRGQETKFFIGNAEIKTDSGIFYADAFITDGEVYLSLDADAMLNNNDHEDFHDLYKKYEQETDAFAAQVLKALEDGGEFESVFSDYQRKYSFLKSANEVYEEILADIYAHKLKITMQDEANIAVSELKNVIDKKRTPTQTEATRKSGFSVAEEARLDSTDAPDSSLTLENDRGAYPLNDKRATRSDAEYMSAVESGDMETAQRLVDEAAKRAGYSQRLYHGAKNGGGFTVFKGWQYFTENKAYAERYTERENSKSLYSVYVKADKPFDTRDADAKEIFDDMRSEYGLSELGEKGLPDWTDGYDISDFIEENNLDYDEILLDEGGDMTENGPVSRGLSYVIRDSAQIKSADPVTYDNDGNIIPLSKRFDSSEADIRFSVPDDADTRAEAKYERAEHEGKQADYDKVELPTAARDYFNKRVNSFIEESAKLMNTMPDVKKDVKWEIRQFAEEILKTGKADARKADEIGARLFNSGILTDASLKKQYADLYKHLSAVNIKVSDTIRSDIADYEDYRRATLGLLKLTKNKGIAVDVLYQQLNEQYPHMFPDSIQNPTDQLLHIVHVKEALKPKQIPNAKIKEVGFKDYAVQQFKNMCDELAAEAQRALNYRKDVLSGTEKIGLVTDEDADAAYKRLAEAQAAKDRFMRKDLLTEKEQKRVELIANGHIGEEEAIPAGMDARRIKEAVPIFRDIAKQQAIIDAHRKQGKARAYAQAKMLTENSDLWKDKRTGLQYMREIQERNIEDIAKNDPEGAKLVKELLIEPVHEHEAEANRYLKEIQKRAAAFDLTKAERVLVQAYGEKLITDEELSAFEGDNKGTKHVQIKNEDGELVYDRKFFGKQGSVQADKVKAAVAEFRAIYDELLDRANAVLVKNGYAPIEKLENYFPHFSTDGGIINTIKRVFFNTDMNIDETLPEDINGQTHTFKPGKTFFSNFLHRKGKATGFDAYQGLDVYLAGIKDVIFHTGDIQNWRAFETVLRQKHTDTETQNRIKEIWESDRPYNIKQEEIENLIKLKGAGNLSNFVAEVSRYINVLTKKKSLLDRPIEQMTNRRIYSILNAGNGRVASNMMGGNVGSWLTNFIPLVQMNAQVKSKYMIKAMKETMKSWHTNDGFVNGSDFLTNRRGNNPLSKGVLDKMGDKAVAPMEYIDMFTTEVCCRAVYYEQIAAGKSHADAMRIANDRTARVVADRSYGALPTIFNVKNPLAKLFTLFQVEVNNQYSNLIKDVPRQAKDEGLKWLIMALIKYFVGAFVFNELFEKMTGRRPAFDPIGYVKDAVKQREANPDTSAGDTAMNVIGNVLEDTPFVGSVLGGGRVPISSAIPFSGNIEDIVGMIDTLSSPDVSAEKKLEIFQDELSKPIYYLFVPTAGGAAKKVIDGAIAAAKGGEYKYNAAGEAEAKFAANQDAGAVLKSLMFGKYSTEEGQKYILSGFKSLSVKQTRTFDKLKEAGIKPSEAFDITQRIYAETGEDGVKYSEARARMKAIGELDISDDAKYALFEDAVLPDTKVEEFNMAMEDYGITKAQLMQVHKGCYGLEGNKDVNGKTIPGTKSINVKTEIDLVPGLNEQQRTFLYDVYEVGEKARGIDTSDPDAVDAMLTGSGVSDKPKVENNAETKIAEAKGYKLPKYRADTLQKIADMGISPEDYAYVRDRVDGHEDKVDYLKSLKFDKQTTASLVEDLVMGDKAHDKMTVAEESYNIPNSTYIDTYMFGYASVGTKAERNEQIHDYVYGLPGLSDTQKEYLYEANQVYRKKNATGEGETGGRTGKKKSSGKSSGGISSGRRKSGGTSGKAKSATKKASSASKTPAKITPRISGALSSGGSSGASGSFKAVPKTSNAAKIVKNAVRNYAKISSNNAMNTAYKSQAEQIDKNPFMTAKQKASAKNRLKRALGL